MFGTANPQTTVPSTISRTSRYGEVHESIRQPLDDIEKYIQTQIGAHDSINQVELSKDLDQVDTVIVSIEKKKKLVENNVERARYLLNELKNNVAKDTRSIESIHRYFEKPGMALGKDESLSYFKESTLEMEKELKNVQIELADLEKALEERMQPSIPNAQSIPDILQSQNRSFLSVAEKIASLHERIGTLKP